MNKLTNDLLSANVDKINVSSVGNSIASGYTMVDEIRPLCNRIEEFFKDDIENEVLDVNFFDLGLAANNSDKHTLEYFTNDSKLSDIHADIKSNYYTNGKMDAPVNLKRDDFDAYYNKLLESDLTINEAILSNEKNNANAVIYCGGTGKFLDNLTRGGIKNPLYYKKMFLEELGYIRSLFNYINSKNRDGSNTQIYLLGLPNFLGLNIISYFNNYYSNISKTFPNVTYVNPNFCQMFYLREGKLLTDFHYSSIEYDHLVKNIYASMNGKFLSNYTKINVDKVLYKLSNENKVNDKKVYETDDIVRMIDTVVSKNYRTKEEKCLFLKSFDKYYKSSFPQDFYYLDDKNLITDLVKKLKK